MTLDPIHATIRTAPGGRPDDRSHDQRPPPGQARDETFGWTEDAGETADEARSPRARPSRACSSRCATRSTTWPSEPRRPSAKSAPGPPRSPRSRRTRPRRRQEGRRRRFRGQREARHAVARLGRRGPGEHPPPTPAAAASGAAASATDAAKDVADDVADAASDVTEKVSDTVADATDAATELAASMSVRPIVMLGDPRLRLKGLPVDSFGKYLHELLDDLAHTMRDAPGVGLAAPQLGVALQACVIEVESQLHELVNPKIVRATGDDRDLEGCLSIPGYVAYVTRHEQRMGGRPGPQGPQDQGGRLRAPRARAAARTRPSRRQALHRLPGVDG